MTANAFPATAGEVEHGNACRLLKQLINSENLIRVCGSDGYRTPVSNHAKAYTHNPELHSYISVTAFQYGLGMPERG